MVPVSHLVLHDTLLQNTTDIITKCHSYFIRECDKSLLQTASAFLLQNTTGLLQNVTVITDATIFLQNATVITNCDVYYRMRQYADNEIWSVNRI